HGTHVSGTIAGVGGNGKGVAGVCWSGVKLISGKFLGRNGGTTANAVSAIDYFNDLKSRHGINLVATNNSWGGGGFSQALQDAIGRANTANILFVAAAGNSGANNDTTASYPSNYPNANIIAVAATTSTGALASYSQYGATTVDIGAPGSAIWSSVPKSSKGKLISGYASYNGTSMATPHVTGAAALYKSSFPAANAADIKAAILGTAVPTPSLAGKTVTGGRLNASGF
ncbi:MAG: S8 family serine peptidase, partial [Pseudomonadota bacterium]|nr:S8 family serine peptidase [Pseudomonadota bacterium]